MNNNLTFELKSSIDRQVSKLLANYGYPATKTVPFDVSDFVKKYGFISDNAWLTTKEEGFLLVNNDDKIIGVHVDLHRNRKCFAIVRAFTTYLLDGDKGNYLIRFNRDVDKTKLSAADYFALSLLMPKDVFNHERKLLEEEGMDKKTMAIILSSKFNAPLRETKLYMDEIAEKEKGYQKVLK